MILLDLEKAFDKVWHDGLILKLLHFAFPIRLVLLIRSFLSNRKAQIAIAGTLSAEINVKAGVPQGSVLSPDLFNTYVVDIPTPANSTLALYADDTAIICKAYDAESIYNHCTTSFNTVQKFFKLWKLKLNIDKTQLMTFTKKTKHYPKLPLILDGSIIKWSNQLNTSVLYSIDG